MYLHSHSHSHSHTLTHLLVILNYLRPTGGLHLQLSEYTTILNVPGYLPKIMYVPTHVALDPGPSHVRCRSQSTT